MNNLKNTYELRKTVRFSLEPSVIDQPYTQQGSGDLKNSVKAFIESYAKVIDEFEKLLFASSPRSDKLDAKVTIKYQWLQCYAKNYYFDNIEQIATQKNTNKISIHDATVSEFLNDTFRDWISENKVYTNNLKHCLDQPLQTQNRTSEYAHWANEIKKRSNFEFIFELFNNGIGHKDDETSIKRTRELLLECKDLLASIERLVLPAQSLGIEIERASFNYYTVNKNPKNYPSEIRNKEKELENPYNFSNNDKDILDKINFSDSHLGISNLKEAIKQFKAQQKSELNEFVSKKKTYSELQKSDLSLFKSIDENKFNQFAAETDKQKRGKHFQYSFKDYNNFCKIYKNVAMSYGKLYAEIKSLEREKIDAERVKSWALILEKNGQKYVLTIPRDSGGTLGKAKKFVSGLSDNPFGDWKLHSFESLTLRALDKLCFGANTTFMPVILGELSAKNQSLFDKGKLKRKDQFSDDGTELLHFYKTVLSLEATKRTLAISSFAGLDRLIASNHSSMDDFEKDLKKICYYKKETQISEDIKDALIKSHHGNLYKITSYDLEKNDPEAQRKLALPGKTSFLRSHPETHTKIWLDFWSDSNVKNNYDIRLNPEFKISFVAARPWEVRTTNLSPHNTNRRLQDKYLLSTTITLNAHEKNVDLSFRDTDDILKSINRYNNAINAKLNSQGIYYYCLDRGQQELVTLGIFGFSQTEKVHFIDRNGSRGQYDKPEFPAIDAYRIKADQYLAEKTMRNGNVRIAYKSVDEFVDNMDVVEKISISSCIDLSCAKLIKGRIVANGDVATYLKLREASAKRKIWDGVTSKKFTSSTIEHTKEGDYFWVQVENKGKKEKCKLYFYKPEFSTILPRDKVQSMLQDYLNEVQASKSGIEIVSIDKINNLRDALSANIVGILNHLQQQYPGVIVFEDLDISNKNHRISQDSANLGSRIEWKVLQKFQALSLVPPNLKSIMSIKDTTDKSKDGKKVVNQLGIVLYIEAKDTSDMCPHCSTKNTDKSAKWSTHDYECKNTHCGFATKNKDKRKGLDALTNSDNVATYNIAKKGKALLSEECNRSRVNI